MNDVGKHNLQSILYQMYLSGTHTDVTLELRCKEPKRFKAHMLILAMRSPIFAKELHRLHHSGLLTFVVEGVSPRTMEIFLRYIYTDCLSAENVEEIVEFEKLSAYYEISDVKGVCRQVLRKYVIDESNVFSLLEASVYFKLKSLHSRCIDFVQTRYSKLLLEGSGFLNVSQETIFHVLDKISDTISEREKMDIMIRWLNSNRKADRSMLLDMNFEFLSAEELLKWIEKYPSLLKPKECLSILLNMLKPGSLPLPLWCRCNPEEENVSEEDTSVSVAIIADSAIRAETDCGRMFLKGSFYGRDGFSCSSRMKLKSNGIQDKLQLLMVELAFGCNYVPRDSLTVNIFKHVEDFPLIRTIKMNFSIHATPDNYYLVFHEDIFLLLDKSFHFTLEIDVRGLKTWRGDEIVSDERYRMMEVDGRCNMILEMKQIEFVRLKPITSSLVAIDTETGKKHFILSSLYFKRF